MINIDVTTKNTVYNTLGAQAQWVQHRFGKRDYPNISLDKIQISDIIHSSDDTINFISVFGDPSCHEDIVEILSEVKCGKVVFNSHLNFKNDSLINLLKEKQSYVVVPLYGINDLCNKIALHSDWNKILYNLKKLNNHACVEFYLFQHNYHQLDEIQELSKQHEFKLVIKEGISVHPEGFSSIVDETGTWLYDAYPCDVEVKRIRWKDLCQTSLGYNHLIQYVKPVIGNSVLEKPKFYKTTKTFDYDKNVSVSVTGHVFPSYTLHQIFSNALCNDWNFSITHILNPTTMTLREDYIFLCAALRDIVLIKNNTLDRFSYKEILSNFTDSNI